MRVGRLNERRASAPRGQRGVVLLITLIILVAMTLAGIGMMRSVDTGSIIAGNMAFRQATESASDAGSAAAFKALISVANSGNNQDKNILYLKSGDPCPSGVTPALCTAGTINLPGYASTPLSACEVTNTCPVVANAKPWWTNNANWNNAPTVTVSDPINGGTIATVQYLIHRMCPAGGPPSGSCQTLVQPGTGCTSTHTPPPPCISTSVYYRITTRSQGVRDTVVYTQTLVLIS